MMRSKERMARSVARTTRNVILKLKLKGPGIRTGRIAIPELIRICAEAQNVISRQAEALQDRKTVHPGPTANTIIDECTLELVGLKRGSTVLEFDLARPQKKLDETASLGSDVVRELADTLKSIKRNGSTKPKEIDEGVLQAIYKLSGIVEGKKITEINWVAPVTGKPSLKATVSKGTREIVAEQLRQPRRAQVMIDGVLEMADFRPEDRKCRIEPAVRAPVICSFSQEQENKVYGLLRKPVKVQGVALLQPTTQRVMSVVIEDIEPMESLAFGEGDFFVTRDIESLAKMQDVSPLKTAGELSGGIPQEEDVDEFLDDIYKSRKAN